jgi:hypothetical protein
MKSRLSIIALLATVACETEDPGLQFNAFKSIDQECEFQAGTNPDLLGFTFDPLLYESFSLYGELQSTVLPPTALLDQESNRNLPGQLSTNVTEFEYVFECDLSGFAGPRQLFLPGSSAVPFCRNPRQPDADFNGEDVVPLSATLSAGEASVVATRVVSPNLANRLVEFFDLSLAADTCCANTPPGQECTTSGSNACDTVQTGIDEEKFSRSQIADLIRFREAVQTTNMDPDFLGPLLLNIKGNYRGITNRGASLTSNEASFTLDVCAGCVNLPYQALRAAAAMGDTDAETALEEFNIVLNCFE